jgi:hypothetical protein
MKTPHVVLLTALAAAIAAAGTVKAQEGRMLRTLPHGTYQCALPGDADGLAFKVVEEEEFRIDTASRYRTSEGSGTYLLRGRELVLTSGPRKGQMYKLVRNNELQRINADGSLGKLRCTRLSGSGR